MDTTRSAATFVVQIERTIAAPPERVFDAFTKAETLSRWFGPTAEHALTVHALDARAGGRYRIEMQAPGGPASVVGGVYDEVSRPHRLVFSWRWEDKPQHGTSRVTVSLEAKGAGTRLSLVHELLPTEDARDAHTRGWNGCLDKLVRLF